MANELRVLIIDDEKRFTEELSEFLENSGFIVSEANTAEAGMSILKNNVFDLLILDVRLPGVNGLDLLKKFNTKYPGMEVIIVSGHGDMETVISALRLGAIDYLRKPFRMMDINIAIERSRKFLELRHKLKKMENENSLISKSLELQIERHFIGISSRIAAVLDMAMSAAEYSDTNVLITGESGTGKENIARIIHYASKRKDHLFCAVNSGAITDSLLESEFFGHKKGSFTGALNDRKGFFEISNLGTLFLDEIADMPLNLQAKMLRAIEEKKITPVGDTQVIQTNFRLISATNHNLDDLVDQKKFRLDLLHRLNTLHIHIPPLRERVEDIEPLLQFFAEDFSLKMNRESPLIDSHVLPLLKSYSFPGNVRELKNLTERAIILCKGNTLTMNDFPIKTSIRPCINGSTISFAEKGHNMNCQQNKSFNLEANETELIKQALQKCSNNRSATALELGIQRMALVRKMAKYNIVVKED